MHIKSKYIDEAIDLNNEYAKKYIKLVSHQDTTGFIETHHIVPVAFYRDILHVAKCRTQGSIDMEPSNLVALSKGHHLLAHYYLMRCAKKVISKQMENAFKLIYDLTDVSKITERDVIKRMHELDEAYKNLKPEVSQYTIDGTLIKTYESVYAAATAMNCSTSNIMIVVSKKQYTAQGYVWAYADTPISDIYFPGKDFRPRQPKKGVSQYSLTGTPIKTYSSILEAAKAVQTSENSITNVLHHRSASAKGYVWAFADTPVSEIYFPGHTLAIRASAKQIAQYSLDGEPIATYKSIHAAAKEIQCQDTTISDALKRKLTVAKGYVWAYLDTPVEHIVFPGNNYAPSCNSPINQYTLDGTCVRSFGTMREAVNNFGGSNRGLRRACKNKTPYYGFLWRYARDVNGTADIKLD